MSMRTFKIQILDANGNGKDLCTINAHADGGITMGTDTHTMRATLAAIHAQAGNLSKARSACGDSWTSMDYTGRNPLPRGIGQPGSYSSMMPMRSF